MDVLEKAHELEREGHHIIHLEIGEPDFPTPQIICEGAVKAIQDGLTHYTHSLGIIELREAICEQYFEKYGVEFSPDQIVITSGTSPALFMIFSALLEVGDEIIISNPHYPCYPNFAEFLGAGPAFVDVYEEDGFQYRPEEIKKRLGSRSKAILINSPSNPTGNLLASDRMEKIADMGPYIVSDEIYHGLVYEEKEHSILEFTDRAFVLNGFSKAYAMTGWRVGYLAAPQSFIRMLIELRHTLSINTSTPAQFAALAALTGPQDAVEKMRQAYAERRVYMMEALDQMGLTYGHPGGGFYIYANISRTGLPSPQFCETLLREGQVLIFPGTMFGDESKDHIRISYLQPLERIREAVARMERVIAKYSVTA
jgi:aspartate/methionine/tyrosine aminotransferase